MIFLDLDCPTPALGDNETRRDASPRFEAFTFHGGEEHVKLRRFEGWPRDTPVTIVARLRSSGDIQRMLLLADACRRRDWRVYGFIPYVPYARQDRVMVPGESFSLKVFLKQLKLAEFEKVAFFDPHSDVVAAMTDALEIKSLIITNESHVKQQATLLGSGETELVIVAPDAGAAKKMAKLNLSHRVVIGNKVRDLNTGYITSYELSGNVRGCRCLVVDDICDGGATFELLARALTAGGAVAKHLFVSHGIFSKGLDSLKAHYATIATTNSFWREEHTSPPHVYRLPFDVF
jgi:ribose-phosphate pyrophosphokinase